MPNATNPGLNPPPTRTPIVEIQPRFGGDGFTDELRELMTKIEMVMTQPWAKYFAFLDSSANSGASGPYSATLTPANNVTPTLEQTAFDGTLFLSLDRVLTTIDPATYNGAYPPDGWKFTICCVNDGTDGRDLAWDPLYLGVIPPSGQAGALEFYSFVTLPAGAGFAAFVAPNVGVGI